MKIVAYVYGFFCGHLETNEEHSDYARLQCRTAGGRQIVAILHGQEAKEIDAEFANLIPQGVEFPEAKFVVELEGVLKIRNGVPTEDGLPFQTFEATSYHFLTGPALDLHRARDMAATATRDAEKLAAEARFEEAFHVLRQFSGPFSRVFVEDSLYEAGPTVEIEATKENASEVTSEQVETPSKALDDGLGLNDDPEELAAEAFGMNSSGALDGPSVEEIVSADPDPATEVQPVIEETDIVMEALHEEPSQQSAPVSTEHSAPSTTPQQGLPRAFRPPTLGFGMARR
ncbi:hypothetical protein ACFOY8_12980 [Thalassospira xianhensis]|uniref:Uncharacterized protein n=1 Tax=Thalassospira xianhensis MCCC 1A02616 TaxID=1177929 RepID=A0A367UHS7_9PROT|nr:hypothetical protein [Thalassospira xianhensis]RCK07865.1 hypothetical protein TH5_02310 [Thalassospira xianhensis MCCC 1A02616]